MQCKECYIEVTQDQSFCHNCGTRVSLRCNNCREELPDSDKFCRKCGTPNILEKTIDGVHYKLSADRLEIHVINLKTHEEIEVIQLYEALRDEKDFISEVKSRINLREWFSSKNHKNIK